MSTEGPKTSETPETLEQKAPVAGSSMPTAAEPEELKETKRPTAKIAVLAVVCLVVLALSIGGLVSAMSNGTVNAGQGGSSTSSTQSSNSQEQAVSITFSIDCYEAVETGNATALAVSDNGAMYSATMRLDAEKSVYDALVASGAVIGSSVSGTGAYVYSINGLAEKDAGSSSGWKYFVNGSAPQSSCSNYILQNGDVVEWRFVLQV